MTAPPHTWRLAALGLLALAGALGSAALGTGQEARAHFLTRWGGPRLRVRARARTGALPKSVRVSPDGTRLVVCNFGQQGADSVFVYDAMTLERVGVVGFAGNPVEAAFAPDGRTVYVSNFRRHLVEVIDLAAMAVRREIPVGRYPKALTVSPDGRRLYVANYGEASVSIVDLAQEREVRRLRTGERPRGVGLLADGRVVAAAFRDHLFHLFAPASVEEQARWTACRAPRDIVTSPDRRAFYATCSRGYIGFYRPEDAGRPFGVAPAGRNPRSLAISGDGRFLGVANFSSRDVALIDTQRRTHRRHRIEDAGRIVGVALHPGAALRLYATSWDTAELLLLTPRRAPAALPSPQHLP
ncbi:MAG: hypothetical protein ACFCGT_20210 [Sandaracinaceae bacterium]